MLRTYLKSCLEGLVVTEVEAGGEPGVRVDSELLAAAQVMPGERARVLLHGGGGAFECYAAAAARGSGSVVVSGVGGLALRVGDRVSLATECSLVDREALAHEARRVRVDENNRPVR
jgi:aspartate 1-decarboxylase